jgi:nitrite reductase/ring-hydroxylating ferredoxin subunit
VIATSWALIADLCGEEQPARPTVGEALRVARAGTVTAAREGGRSVALVVLPDRRAYAVDDRCPHDGGPLSDGFLDGDRLVCARHGWEVDPCSGTCGRRQVASSYLGVV